ncbi:hypothetical protein M501DRAFT_926759 [Patellaria atrata CBS 101060]|uniref:C2H2-type domain-containing protein n=1 Tax=Patellaria atrata CBS 101060 TaxID=1346257 RepID=A0A9P4SHH7_9PEZI|nr:hypothetical protein M501DRAFT_926759 [Patellaria atrata CBS 101060]
MPRAEVGSTKYLANRMKMKGLQRLRWYCQPCERQMRDENAFKQHTMSESHIRNMLAVGENTRSHISQWSTQFQNDFVNQLRTSHQEKPVVLNHMYQQYISHKEHIHMNATRWNSLTEFALYLGREGICCVEEDPEKGLTIAWINNSPDALRRQEALRKKERENRGDEEREQRMIREQVAKAKAQRETSTEDANEEEAEDATILQRAEGEKIKLSFGSKPQAVTPITPPKSESELGLGSDKAESQSPDVTRKQREVPQTATPPVDDRTTDAIPVKVSIASGAIKPKNIFAAAKKSNPLSNKKSILQLPPKKMSEAERIMKEEIERKRAREASGLGGSFKKQRIG